MSPNLSQAEINSICTEVFSGLKDSELLKSKIEERIRELENQKLKDQKENKLRVKLKHCFELDTWTLEGSSMPGIELVNIPFGFQLVDKGGWENSHGAFNTEFAITVLTLYEYDGHMGDGRISAIVILTCAGGSLKTLGKASVHADKIGEWVSNTIYNGWGMVKPLEDFTEEEKEI